MNRRLLAASALSSALGLVIAVQAIPVRAAEMTPQMQQKLDAVLKKYPGADKAVIEKNMERVAAQHLQQCFGINAVAKNDCASGAHSCAGQSTMARDPKAFVLLPAGDCGKIAGGHLEPM